MRRERKREGKKGKRKRRKRKKEGKKGKRKRRKREKEEKKGKRERRKEKGREGRKKGEEEENRRGKARKTQPSSFFFLLNNHQVDPFRGNPLSGQRNPFKGGGVIRHPFGGLELETGQKGCHPLLKGLAFF